MEQIQLLETEIELLKENIKRLKKYRNENIGNKYKPYNSLVVGEFKHRLTALKQRCVILQKVSTHDFLEK